MKFCTHCGTGMQDEAKFCTKCGAPANVSKTEDTQPQNVKFCTYCGAAMMQDAAVCLKCGCPVKPVATTNTFNTGSGYQTAAKVLMILSCVGCAVVALVMALLAIVLNGVMPDVSAEVSAELVSEFGFSFNFAALYLIMAVFCLVPLFWLVPMTKYYFKAVKNHKHVGVGFKVCTLLFVNLIAGILMLCDPSDYQ